MNKEPEVWLCGPLKGIPILLQPIAHALLQARKEVNEIMVDLPETLLWEKPAMMASPGFHLQHMAGVLDRLFTYAQGRQLTQQQLEYLANEGKDTGQNVKSLLATFNQQVDIALKQLSKTDELKLIEFRGVGREQLPSTVIGLLVHTAEHTMRHTGQLLITVHWIINKHSK